MCQNQILGIINDLSDDSLMSPGKKSLQIGGKVWTIFATFRVGEALYGFSQKELYRAFWKIFHGFY